MYIVNTSFMVEPKAHALWIQFMNHKFLPRLEEEELGNIFFSRVLSQQQEGHYTYSVQIHTDGLDHYQRYMEEIFEDYLQITTPMFNNTITYFTSVMKCLNQ